MASDKTGTWNEGESVLWYSPNSGINTTWNEGESFILDEYDGETNALQIFVHDAKYVKDVFGNRRKL